MTTRRAPAKQKVDARMPRASVSFPPELHDTLERIAKQKKVSVAWVVREAAEQYVASQWPLFGAASGGGQRHG
ncbi:CopG family transcriptional regulator [Methylibium rhizosphaerae]|uniref:ribbon-helix-helix domain-containing protein n=1 Tax=Methylibium rhizosphaerae TaxID=2570323 RepID=UPI001C6155DF|nr:CopG family transcriptional regulator [Methylibium rhizosphaerae]